MVLLPSTWTLIMEKLQMINDVREYSRMLIITTIIVEPADGETFLTISYGSTTGWYVQNQYDGVLIPTSRVLKLEK